MTIGQRKGIIRIIKKTSNAVFWIMMLLVTCTAAVVFLSSRLNIALKLTWVVYIIYFLAFIFFITPGLTIWTAPWISLAWLRGYNSIAIPQEPWDKLNGWDKGYIYIISVLELMVGLAIAYFVLSGQVPLH